MGTGPPGKESDARKTRNRKSDGSVLIWRNGPRRRISDPCTHHGRGSHSVAGWLERLKTDYYRNRISRSQLSEIHDMAVQAELKNQETAGIKIVSDEELCRDNGIDYRLARVLTDRLHRWVWPRIPLARAPADRSIMFSVTWRWHINPDRARSVIA